MAFLFFLFFLQYINYLGDHEFKCKCVLHFLTSCSSLRGLLIFLSMTSISTICCRCLSGSQPRISSLLGCPAEVYVPGVTVVSAHVCAVGVVVFSVFFQYSDFNIGSFALRSKWYSFPQNFTFSAKEEITKKIKDFRGKIRNKIIVKKCSYLSVSLIIIV